MDFLTSFFSKGHQRTILAKKNIAITFLIKGFSIVISFLMVPLTIQYVEAKEYGIWLTISSFITWFTFFDIGFGNGLKNKLSEAIAIKDYKLAKAYVSTTYVVLVLISSALLLSFLLFNYFADWSRLLNAPQSLSKELSLLVLIVFSAFAVQFILQLINVVVAARQNSFISSVINLCSSLLTLGIIFFLTKTTEGSLLYLGLTVSLCPLFIFGIFTIVLYRKSYKQFAPSIKAYNVKYVKSLMGLGFKFFLIQIGLIFFYNTDNLIITNVISPEAVTTYNIAFRYFSVITMLTAIVMAPIWPAITEAQAKGDIEWIKLTVIRLLRFCLVLGLLGLLMLMGSKILYKFWVGPDIHVPFSLSLVLFAFTMINAYRTVFCYYLNGVGKITVEIYIIVGSGLLNIPLGIALGKTLGTTGVILSSTVLCFFCAIIETIQYRKLITNKAYGVWNR